MEQIVSDKKLKLKFMNYAMLGTHGLNLVISVFVSTFLISYIYSISDNYVLNIGLFYCFNYLSMGILYFLISTILDKTNRITFYRIAIVIRFAFILCVIFLGKKLANYVILAGVFHGFSEACYWTSYNVMKNELVPNRSVRVYSAYQQIIEKMINIVIPLTLGKIIDADSFKTSAIIVLIVAGIELILSIFIKSKRPENSTFDFKGFISRANALGERKKLVSFLIIIGGFYGLCNVLTPINTIIVMYAFNSNFTLGIVNSVFAFCAIIYLIILKRFTKAGKRKAYFLLSSILPVIATILYVFKVTNVTLIIYSGVVTVCSVTHAYAYDILRNIILKKLDMYDDIAEFQCAIECFMETMRAISFLLMTIAGLVGASLAEGGMLVVLKVFMCIAIFALPLVNISLLCYEKSIVKHDLVEN